jgi:predicted HTH transcriptional regulator
MIVSIRVLPSVSRCAVYEDRTVKKNIDSFKKKGVVKRIGPDKGRSWEITIE